ncbi:MAG TPA: class I SAM-dependent methyltransferase [Candidatus Aphodovivens avistercoris]|nr:class I SAM-dependent methyltransferase [Candidatus Aphodovivens avistercoris]
MMDPRVVDMIRRLNNDFYFRCAPSFSATRQAPWEGWRACVPHLEAACRPSGAAAAGGAPAQGARPRLEVLDVACGNGRFEAFLPAALPGADVRMLGADGCAELLPTARPPQAAFARFDALDALVRGEPWGRALVPTGASFDAAVCFGFFHHIPSRRLRERALRELVDAVRPGGVAIVSLWCFLEDARLARKAEASHAAALAQLEGSVALAAQLEPGDRFLGWQDEPGLWRWCHSFDDAQADELAASVCDAASEEARFRSDGKTGRLNLYLIFRKH